MIIEDEEVLPWPVSSDFHGSHQMA